LSSRRCPHVVVLTSLSSRRCPHVVVLTSLSSRHCSHVVVLTSLSSRRCPHVVVLTSLSSRCCTLAAAAPPLSCSRAPRAWCAWAGTRCTAPPCPWLPASGAPRGKRWWCGSAASRRPALGASCGPGRPQGAPTTRLCARRSIGALCVRCGLLGVCVPCNAAARANAFAGLALWRACLQQHRHFEVFITPACCAELCRVRLPLSALCASCAWRDMVCWGGPASPARPPSMWSSPRPECSWWYEAVRCRCRSLRSCCGGGRELVQTKVAGPRARSPQTFARIRGMCGPVPVDRRACTSWGRARR
jgi:hypothetical protein